MWFRRDAKTVFGFSISFRVLAKSSWCLIIQNLSISSAFLPGIRPAINPHLYHHRNMPSRRKHQLRLRWIYVKTCFAILSYAWRRMDRYLRHIKKSSSLCIICSEPLLGPTQKQKWILVRHAVSITLVRVVEHSRKVSLSGDLI